VAARSYLNMPRRSQVHPIIVLLMFCLSSIPASADTGDTLPAFDEVTIGSGFEFIDSGPTTIWSSYGPGVAWGDYDEDGDQDVFITARFDHLGQETAELLGYSHFSEIPSNSSDFIALDENATGTTHLMRNNGDGTFTDVSESSGISTDNSTTLGATWADYDGDGDVDLYLSNYGHADLENPHGTGTTNQMYRNVNGTFVDVTIESNLGNPGHSSASVWADYDHDGDLDCYSMNFGMIDEYTNQARTESNILYRNEGDSNGDGIPEFSDETKEAGGVYGQKESAGADFETFIGPALTIQLTGPVNPSAQMSFPAGIREEPTGSGMSWAAVWFDADGDGWEDLYIASDFGTSPLYRNNQDGSFEIVTAESGLNKQGTGMGAHAADIDNDGDLDLCQSNFGPNFLWNNMGDGTFSEDSEILGLHTNTLVNWDCHFFDFDLDGDLDLWFGVGRINLYISSQYNSLYRNDGDTNGDGYIEFTDVAAEIGLSDDNKTMGVALADYDNDGDLDLLLAHADRSPRLWRNNAVESGGGQWIKVQLHGAGASLGGSNSNGVGCLVTITLEDGSILNQHAYAGDGFLGNGDPSVFFGLGNQSISEISVTWSTGHIQSLSNITENSVVDIFEIVPDEPSSNNFSMFFNIIMVLSVAFLLYNRL